MRPLDLTALRDHTTSPSPSDSLPLSATNYNRWPDALSILGDTPRSWATASYATALPQTSAEIEGMDVDDLNKLVVEAGVLRQRAATALRLAQQRLEESNNSANSDTVSIASGIISASANEGLVEGSGAISAIAQIVLHLYISVLALLILVMMLLEGGMRVLGRARSGEVARMQRGVYSAMGAVAGLAHGVGGFVQHRKESQQLTASSAADGE